MAAMWSHDGEGRVNLCLCIEPDPEVGGCMGNELHLYCLTGMHATIQVIARSLIYTRNLACGESIRLDCCDVIFTTCELGMTIITLSRLYFVVSCRLAPTDVAHVQDGRCAAARSQAV
jgi:hypothetical protein